MVNFGERQNGRQKNLDVILRSRELILVRKGSHALLYGPDKYMLRDLDWRWHFMGLVLSWGCEENFLSFEPSLASWWQQFPSGPGNKGVHSVQNFKNVFVYLGHVWGNMHM